MARKDVELLVRNSGISSELETEIWYMLVNGCNFENLRSLMVGKGFAEELARRVWVAFWDTHGSLSSFDEELGEKLENPEFKKLLMDEMEKLRQKRK